MSSHAAEPAPRLEPGICQLWWARPGDANPALGRLLDPDELARAASFVRPADRDRFTVARALTRLALADCLAKSPETIMINRTCGRCGRSHGKPRLTGESSRAELSVSHGGDRVVVALTLDTPLGVDVEPVPLTLAMDELAAEALTVGEAATLDGMREGERVRAFLVYWTRKEAVAKATGAGLALPLRAFSVSPPGVSARVTANEEGLWTGPMRLHDLDPGPGHVASLAVMGACDRLVDRDGSGLLASWKAATTSDA